MKPKYDNAMINRRTLGKGLLTASAVVAGAISTSACASSPALPVGTPLRGAWTATGSLRRAGGVLHYATIGEPNPSVPPVVLLHKLGGWLSDWRHVAPLLAKGRQIIAFDLPGHGGSRWDGPAPYILTLGEIASLLVGALDEMGIDKVHLFGTSLGGCVAVSLAAFWPERIQSLAIISSALGGRRTLDQIKIIVDDKQTDLFDKNGDPLPTTPEQLRQIFGIVNPQKISVEGNQSRLAAGRWIQPCERGVAITDIAGMIPRIQSPTLLVYGEFDKAYHKFRSVVEPTLRNGRTAVVKNSGAFVMQDNPDETARILNELLAGA
ncbi:alpha/beta fold hydrolase [Novosphingobium sp. AAP83]|uniref:alpha/beta fold hydrolase n=1 Tax=Novosphingobium sp. AAP83 TaxID=1523425 RepID=UPI000AD948CD|nr:alpha/beta hydrolase [Novosphingobium sp. AAP83]